MDSSLQLREVLAGVAWDKRVSDGGVRGLGRGDTEKEKLENWVRWGGGGGGARERQIVRMTGKKQKWIKREICNRDMDNVEKA